MNKMASMDRETLDQARSLVAEALLVAPDEVTDDTAIGVTERWDSLAHLRLMLALEEHLSCTIETDDMMAIESLSDVAAFLADIQASVR